eukprot:GILI01026037.1.p1 GENE.GILI01026037.1~~GILI01026037.1.p1  ORF type:complete len:578 (-),score=55.56 GILI01026037.1:291-1988(-)
MLRRVTDQAASDNIGPSQLLLFYGNDLIRTACTLLNLNISTACAASHFFNRYAGETLIQRFGASSTQPSWFRRSIIERENEAISLLSKQIFAERDAIIDTQNPNSNDAQSLEQMFATLTEKYAQRVEEGVASIKAEGLALQQTLAPGSQLVPSSEQSTLPSNPATAAPPKQHINSTPWSCLSPSTTVLSLWDLFRELPNDKGMGYPLRGDFNILPVAAACVLIAAKTTCWRLPEGSHMLSCIAAVFERLDRRRKGAKAKDVGSSHGGSKIVKEAMLLFEKDILEVLSFETSSEAPHKYALCALALLTEDSGLEGTTDLKNIQKDVLRICNDASYSHIFTAMPPMVVACASIHIALSRCTSDQTAHSVYKLPTAALPKDWPCLFDVRDSQLGEALYEFCRLHTSMENVAFRTLSRITPLSGPGKYMPPTHSNSVSDDADTAGGTAPFCSLLSADMAQIELDLQAEQQRMLAGIDDCLNNGARAELKRRTETASKQPLNPEHIGGEKKKKPRKDDLASLFSDDISLERLGKKRDRSRDKSRERKEKRERHHNEGKSKTEKVRKEKHD